MTDKRNLPVPAASSSVPATNGGHFTATSGITPFVARGIVSIFRVWGLRHYAEAAELVVRVVDAEANAYDAYARREIARARFLDVHNKIEEERRVAEFERQLAALDRQMQLEEKQDELKQARRLRQEQNRRDLANARKDRIIADKDMRAARRLTRDQIAKLLLEALEIKYKKQVAALNAESQLIVSEMTLRRRKEGRAEPASPPSGAKDVISAYFKDYTERAAGRGQASKEVLDQIALIEHGLKAALEE